MDEVCFPEEVIALHQSKVCKWPSCLQFAPGRTEVCLQPNPPFDPKVGGDHLQISHWGVFGFSPTFLLRGGASTVRPDVDTAGVFSRFRKADQLTVSWGTKRNIKDKKNKLSGSVICQSIDCSH